MSESWHLFKSIVLLPTKATIPRTANKQMHRYNYKVSSPKDFFRIVLATPVIQRFNSEND